MLGMTICRGREQLRLWWRHAAANRRLESRCSRHWRAKVEESAQQARGRNADGLRTAYLCWSRLQSPARLVSTSTTHILRRKSSRRTFTKPKSPCSTPQAAMREFKRPSYDYGILDCVIPNVPTIFVDYHITDKTWPKLVEEVTSVTPLDGPEIKNLLLYRKNRVVLLRERAELKTHAAEILEAVNSKDEVFTEWYTVLKTH